MVQTAAFWMLWVFCTPLTTWLWQFRLLLFETWYFFFFFLICHKFRIYLDSISVWIDSVWIDASVYPFQSLLLSAHYYLFHFQIFPCIMHLICIYYFNSSFAIIFIIESFIKLHLCFKHIQFDLSIFIGLSACGYCIASHLFLHYNKFTNKLYISYRIAWIS